MPKRAGKANRSAILKNDRMNKGLIDDESVLFGRVLKSLGNCRFRIQTTDEDDRGVEVDAAIGGRSVIRIHPGDLVVVGRNDSAGKVNYEIFGACDKKTIGKLKEAERLHPSLFSETDDLTDDIFDRSEDLVDDDATTVAAATKKDKANKPSKVVKLATESDDVDVDAI
jgi:translation initiation factor IF-1